MTHRAKALVRWVAGVIGICGAVCGLFAMLAHVAGPAAWTARQHSSEPILHPLASRYLDSTARFAAIDSYVVSEMKAVRAPGVGLVIVQDDDLVHVRGFGVADPSGKPVTPQTPFILGSLTKSFTALAIMQLADQGRIGLDDPVRRYLPWFRVRDLAASMRITIRELLEHTSGIPESAGMLIVRGSRAATPAEQAAMLRGARLRDTPGRSFEYSNANYWLLGLIVESVSGQSFKSYVPRWIFDPLEMQNSFTSEAAARARGLAQGYRVWFGFPRAETLPYYSRELSVGYLISTPEDKGKYLVAQLNGGRYRGPPVISARGLADLHTPPPGKLYAMGWLADSVASTPILWHTGAVANYHCDMLIAPSAHVGVAILANVNNFLLERQFSQTIKGVSALLLGYQPQPRNSLRYRETYWIITVAAVFWLGWRLHQVGALRRWWHEGETDASGVAMRWQPHPAATLLDPGLSLGFFFGMPLWLGSPISTLRWFVPDLTDWMILNMFVALTLAVCRLAILRHRAVHRARHLRSLRAASERSGGHADTPFYAA